MISRNLFWHLYNFFSRIKAAWDAKAPCGLYVLPLKSNFYEPDLSPLNMGIAQREQRPPFVPSIIHRNHTLRLGNHIAIAVHVARRNIVVGDHFHAIAGMASVLIAFEKL